MEQSSYLDPDSLYIQCQNALEVIEAENEAYANLRLSLQNKVIEATSTSDSVDNYKAYASDLCLVLDKIIEANELDKADFEEVKTALNTILTDKVEIYEDLIGSRILMNIENTQSSIETCKSMIESLKAEADSSIFASWAYSSQISEWESKLEGYESVLEEFRYKEQRYDDIESVTSGLFKDSIELRQIAWAALEDIVMVDGKYEPDSTSDWRRSFEHMDAKKQNPEFYAYLCNLKNPDGTSKFSEDDIFSIIAYGHKYYGTSLAQIGTMKGHSLDSAINDMMSNIVSGWENSSFESKSRKIYDKLSAEQKNWVENLELLPYSYSDKLQCMKNTAIYLFADGYEPEFVCGILGNIYHEGRTGLFEDSNYDESTTKPYYLVDMDNAVDFTHQYSTKTIMEVGIEKTIELASIGDFGIGACQWTFDDRTSVLLDCYLEVCGDDNFPTEEQAMTAEALCIVRELENPYYNNEVYQRWKKGSMLSAEQASEIVLRYYEKPDDIPGKINERKGTSSLIYEYMMG